MSFNDASRRALDNAKVQISRSALRWSGWNQFDCHVLGHLVIVSLMEAISVITKVSHR